MPFADLKNACEGEGLVKRAKYRKQVQNSFSGLRPAIEKGEKYIAESVHANLVDEKLKNEYFGFACLHYSVSEGAGKLRVKILNKTKSAGIVKVKTVDAEA